MIDPHTRGAHQIWNAVRRYIVWIALLMLVWEIVQLPLYTLWRTASWRDLIVAVLHCTAGDLAIAVTTLIVSILVTNSAWPAESRLSTFMMLIFLGAGYTVYSEWSNLARGAWAYSEWMPQLPVLNTGIAPLLQWILMPPLALKLAMRTGKSSAGSAGPAAN